MQNKFLLLVPFLLAGCNLADEFLAPEIKSPPKFKEADRVGKAQETGKWKEAKPAESLDKGEWWKIFNDEKLNQLQEELAKNNNDLVASAARLKQFAALDAYARGAQLPVITGEAGTNRQKTSQNTTGGSFNKDPFSTYVLGATISYELDIVGKISNDVKAAEKDFESAEAAHENIMLLMQANLAQVYFSLQATDEELALVKNTIDLRTEQNDIIKKREELGAASLLESKLSDTELANIKLQALELDKNRAKLEHSLAVLLGKVPAEVEIANKNLNFSQPKITPQLPSEVLQRRPDIAAAIRSLEAENARVGIARAAYFPDISLTASGGLQSEQLGNLFNWSSRTWLLGPAAAGTLITGVIFDGGRFAANTDVAEARYEEAVANYRQKVLVAFQEVEDSLSDLAIINDQLTQADIAYASAYDAERMTKIRYDEGASSYFDLKDAELAAITAGRQRINTRLASMLGTISFVKAIGGGWNNGAAEVGVKQ